MRRAFVTAVMALALVSLPSAAVGIERPAAEGGNLVCFASPYPLSVTPGLTMTPSEQTTFQSTAPSVIDCHGSVQGRQVTGRGQVIIEKAVALGPRASSPRAAAGRASRSPRPRGPLRWSTTSPTNTPV